MSEPLTIQTDISCFHCGDKTVGKPILFDEKAFCCDGCKMVYEILNTSDLCTYYDLNENPGIQIKAGKSNDKFSYLDNEKIVEKLINYKDETFTKVSFFLPQIHCASCIWLLENLYKLNPGISSSRVNFLRKEVYISFENQQISLRRVVELLSSIGYEPLITLSQTEDKPKPKKLNSFTYKLGVAGFCFGNIMLLSFPEYLGLSHVVESGYTSWFGYLNLFLALPVFFFSSTEFFRSAWLGLKQKRLNIDVPVSIGILTLFIRSSYEILFQIGPGFLDSLAGLVFFLLAGKWFQNRTYQSLSFERDYKAYFPVAATRIEDGEEKSVMLAELATGDKLLIPNEGLIPADAILLSPNAQIDYSFVTGESKPVSRQTGNLLFAGGRLKGAAIEVELTKKVSQSYLTNLWNNEAFQEKSSSFHTLTDQFGQYFTITVLLVALASGIYWYLFNPSIAIQVFSAVLIVACPCALALAGPVTLGNALRILGKKMLYLKHPQVIEQIGKVDHITFDKTGTITQAGEEGLFWQGNPIDQNQKDYIYSLAKNSLHPISHKIALSLNSDKKYSITEYTESTGKGISGIVKGNFIKIGSPTWLGIKREKSSFSGASVSINGEFLGDFIIQSSYRKGLKDLPGQLEKYGLSVLSGDNENEEKNLKKIFPSDTPMLWDQSPEEKLEYIAALKKEGKSVMMIGDGLNDAGALAQSDTGIVISDNIHHFSPACDGILDAKSFDLLPKILRFSRLSVKMVWLGIAISVLYNIVGLAIAVQGYLTPVIAAILMPLSSISAVLIGLVSTEIIGKKVFNQSHSSD